MAYVIGVVLSLGVAAFARCVGFLMPCTAMLWRTQGCPWLIRAAA
jgi:hypothetical protein